MAMKRPDQGSPGVAGNLSRDDVLHGWLPVLHDHLTDGVWEDGKPRKTTTMMILTENGMWKAWLHDRDSKRNAWVSGASWEDLLETVEKCLAHDTLEWRKDTR